MVAPVHSCPQAVHLAQLQTLPLVLAPHELAQQEQRGTAAAAVEQELQSATLVLAVRRLQERAVVPLELLDALEAVAAA
jgi:hypothetical protein